MTSLHLCPSFALAFVLAGASAVAADAGQPPAGKRCEVNAGGVPRTLSVAVGRGSTLLLSPTFRELWASTAWTADQVRCADGGLSLLHPTGPIPFDVSGDGEHLSLDSAAVAVERALEAAVDAPPSALPRTGHPLFDRWLAVEHAAEGLTDREMAKRLRADEALVRDLWVRETWWQHGGAWPSTWPSPYHYSSELSDTPRGRRLSTEIAQLRASRAPVFVGAQERIGATPVDDLSDLVWSGEVPCIAQDPGGARFRCYDVAKHRWGPKQARPVDAAQGTRIGSHGPVSYRGRQVQIDLEGLSSDAGIRCLVTEGDTVWQQFSVDEPDDGKTFCPVMLGLSPSGRVGVGLVPARTSHTELAGGNYREFYEYHGYRLWLFSTST